MNKFDLSTREGQVGAARAAAVLLVQINDLVMRGVYERFVADATNLERTDVALLVQQAAKTDRRASVSSMSLDSNPPTSGDSEQSPELNENIVSVDDPLVVNEKWLVIVLGQIPDACKLEDFARIGKSNFSQPWFRDIARVIYQVRSTQGSTGLFEAVQQRLDENLKQVFTKLMLTSIPANDDESRQKFAEGVISRALEKSIEYEKSALRASRRSAEALEYTSAITELDLAIAALDSEIHAMRRARS
jgi:DNA primase